MTENLNYQRESILRADTIQYKQTVTHLFGSRTNEFRVAHIKPDKTATLKRKVE